MKRILPLLLCLLLLTGCGGNAADGSYEQITQETAKEMMDTQEVIILDVREQNEYDSGHIPGAVLLPVGTIDENTAAEVIPEKDSTVLVYCRSGNRSKTASSTLADLGYTNIYEFGGIMRTPLKKCSLTADDGASPPLEWCTHSAEMVHGGRWRGAPGRHAGNHSGIPLRFRMDSPSIWMV